MEVDLLQRTGHARTERVIKSDGMRGLAVEGHAKRLHKPRPTEVEVPQRLRITLLHDAVVALVETHVWAVSAAGWLWDSAGPGEVNLDGLVMVDGEEQLLLGGVRNDIKLETADYDKDKSVQNLFF